VFSKLYVFCAQVSTKSDVWSLGCILYNLVYNHTPFDSFRNPLQKLQAITDHKHEIVFPNTEISDVVDVLKVFPVVVLFVDLISGRCDFQLSTLSMINLLHGLFKVVTTLRNKILQLQTVNGVMSDVIIRCLTPNINILPLG
jgi:serine/threonine protein kinase